MSATPPPLDLGSAYHLTVLALGYLGLLATSGYVVRGTLSLVDTADVEVTDRERDVGAVVGKAENVLTVTLVVLGAYTALAVVFAAKNVVRKDDIEKNSLFYLAGTLVNFTYSVIVGALVAGLLRLG